MINIKPREDVFFYYFYFMQERMNIFWHKCTNNDCFLTKDPILRKYKFTNVYRACDRVSQYLINNIIYKDVELFSPEDVLLKILVFKVFNKIETWEYLKREIGEITINRFDVDLISSVLTKRILYSPIFNNAYMMSGSHKKYDYLKYKHEKWLAMIKKEFIGNDILYGVLRAKSLEEIYKLLKSCSFIGEFLAYQYAVDFNYSPYINFDENSFVKAGIGAIRGIKKCFSHYGMVYEDAIYYTWENLDFLREKYGYNNFISLPGHEPSLIDLQNCFCETDKYLRAKMPELRVDNIRIKQKYVPSKLIIDFKFPPKWKINREIKTKCIQKSIMESMLF